MKSKPEIVFTLPACMGGVASFNFNIINHSILIKNFHSKVILIKAKEDFRADFQDTFKVDEIITFNYSINENQYYVMKRLNKLFGDGKGAIVTDNALTVTAARLFNNPKTIFHLAHDYFYVNETIRMKDMIDVSIAHSSFFSDAIFAANPSLFFERSIYIPYGVKQLASYPFKSRSALNLVFLGRLDEGKGVLKLHDINRQLIKNGVLANWTIIGKGPLKEALQQQWKSKVNVVFCEPDSTIEVYKLLGKQDIFVFPTSFEGTPVSILECLANAVVPVTNDLPGGIRDIVGQDIGFRCKFNDIDEYARVITKLDSNRSLLEQMQRNCFQIATNSYNIKSNADHYFRTFMDYLLLSRNTKVGLIRRAKLDSPLFPNFIVKIVRGIR